MPPASWRSGGGGSWSLVANLPYNLATPLVLRTLVEVPAIHRLLVMVQREVGERMAATVGDPAYGSVSVRVAYFARSSLAGRSRRPCSPPPPGSNRCWSGWSAVPSRLSPVEEVSYERLAAVVKAGFGQRRKMLRSPLAGVVAPEAFARAGIRPEARAEELTVEEWGRLAR